MVGQPVDPIIRSTKQRRLIELSLPTSMCPGRSCSYSPRSQFPRGPTVDALLHSSLLELEIDEDFCAPQRLGLSKLPNHGTPS
jgi:hypothetical protein